jgi:hypothetical protein
MDFPKILSMKVYLAKAGMPIYFGYDDEDKVYNHPEKSWQVKPSYMDHFKSRELRPEDLHLLVLDGIISDDDFAALSNNGLIDDLLVKFFHKMKELQNHIREYEGGIDEMPEMEPFATVNEPEQPEQSRLVSILDDFLERLRTVDGSIPSSALQKIIEGSQGLSEDEKRILSSVSGKFNLEPIKNETTNSPLFTAN